MNLINRLNEFNINANLGLNIDLYKKYTNYSLVYSKMISDNWYNYITNINCTNKNEFNNIIQLGAEELSRNNRETTIAVLPYMSEIYNNRNLYFPEKEFKLIATETWQIFDDLSKIDNIQSNCLLDIKLEKTTDMELYSNKLIEMYRTGDLNDPYGNLDISYRDAYSRFKVINNSYKTDFYLVKSNDEIVGVTEGTYDTEIYGIYGIVVKKEFRKKGIGKEIIKQQLQMCKDKNLKIAFLQTEQGYYPAEFYRKIGFKDICECYFYKLLQFYI